MSIQRNNWNLHLGLFSTQAHLIIECECTYNAVTWIKVLFWSLDPWYVQALTAATFMSKLVCYSFVPLYLLLISFNSDSANDYPVVQQANSNSCSDQRHKSNSNRAESNSSQAKRIKVNSEHHKTVSNPSRMSTKNEEYKNSTNHSYSTSFSALPRPERPIIYISFTFTWQISIP